MAKIPKFFIRTDYTLSRRPKTPVDELESDGTALDTAHKRPSHAIKSLKRSKKQVMVMENWVHYLQTKGKV